MAITEEKDRDLKRIFAPLLLISIAVLLFLAAILILIDLLSAQISFPILDQWWPVLVVASGIVWSLSTPQAMLSGAVITLLGLVLFCLKMGWLDSSGGHAIEALFVAVFGLALLVLTIPKLKS